MCLLRGAVHGGRTFVSLLCCAKPCFSSLSCSLFYLPVLVCTIFIIVVYSFTFNCGILSFVALFLGGGEEKDHCYYGCGGGGVDYFMLFFVALLLAIVEIGLVQQEHQTRSSST
eukprot:m.46510 g.46510  ORF g.46510 m.46510 type:complete len:114 (+) comp7272_c1_seq1:88-429(+)